MKVLNIQRIECARAIHCAIRGVVARRNESSLDACESMVIHLDSNTAMASEIRNAWSRHFIYEAAAASS